MEIVNGKCQQQVIHTHCKKLIRVFIFDRNIPHSFSGKSNRSLLLTRNSIKVRFKFLSTFHVYLTYLIFDSLFFNGNFSLENRGKTSKGDIYLVFFNSYFNFIEGHFYHSSLHQNIHAKPKQKAEKIWIFLTTNCAC